MRGDNPIRPPVKGDGLQLDVKEIFTTLQGEGPFAGYPAVFVRLGGCNLACAFCDTDFEEFTNYTLDILLAEIKAHAQEDGQRVRPLVVITGGEPLRQNIVPLCGYLLEEGFEVQIETNGTLYQPLDERVHIVCSPKISNDRYAALRPDILPQLNTLKFLISASCPAYNTVPELGQSDHRIPVYLQPMDEYDEAKNKANRELALRLAMKHGYRLSLQQHKILGIA